MTAALTSVGVQTGTITIASGNLTGTATITAVGSGAFLIWQGQNANDTTDNGDATASITLTNSTTITATRGSTGTAKSMTVNYVIVDGDTTNLIKSVQFGTVTMAAGSGSGTATISAVTNNNTAIVFLGNQVTGGAPANATRLDTNLSLSGTTVTATRVTNLLTGTITGFCVIEFQGTALNSAVQNIAYSVLNNVSTDTSTITSVTANNTFLAFGGYTGGSTVNVYHPYITLTNGTTITYTWNTAANITRKFNLCVVEFVGGILTSAVQRGTIALSAATSNTATITSVTAANTLLNWLNNSTSSTILDPTLIWYKETLTNGTTITMTSNSSATGTGAYEVIEFNPPASGANTVTETVTESDSVTILATDSASLSDTVTENDASAISATDLTTLLETQTETDSYSSLIILTNSFTENITASDSFRITATQSTATSESNSATDSIAGAATGLTNLNESGTATDSHLGIASGLGLVTESDTVTDAFLSSGTQAYNDTITETVAANDNYSSSVTPATSSVSSPPTGTGDEIRRRKYLDWLRRRKKKPAKLDRNKTPVIALQRAIPSPAPTILDSEYAARSAAINTIISLISMPLSPVVSEAQLYELLELINELREEDDEEAFMIL